MPFQIVHNDITKMHTDAIVNAANSGLLMGGGVCGAIFRAAGAEELQEECDRLAPCAVGHAVLTVGFKLPAKYVIHAVGPVWHGGHRQERKHLASAYLKSLHLAKEAGCVSIAFPLISAGIYGYPKKEALEVAEQTIRAFLENNEMDVYLAVMDRTVVELSEAHFRSVQHFVDTFYEPEEPESRTRRGSKAEFEQIYEEDDESMRSVTLDYLIKKTERKEAPRASTPVTAPRPSTAPKASTAPRPSMALAPRPAQAPYQIGQPRQLDDLVSHLNETFQEMLLRLIDEKGYTDVQVYKRANMDRKLFSKIRSNREYQPKKKTVLALAISLKLSLDETLDLLEKAGYILSHSFKSDVIVRYFLENEDWDIFLINDTLFYFGEDTI